MKPVLGKALWSVLLLLGSATCAFAGAEEDKILNCMRKNIPASVQVREFEILAIDQSGGKRVMRGRLYAKLEEGLLRASARLMAPPDVQGTSYLMREGPTKDDMFVYLPALQKTRRIIGRSGDGALFGTDISYSDIKQIYNAFSGSKAKIEGQEIIEGRKTTRLSAAPDPAQKSKFNNIRAWIDNESCVALKAEFIQAGIVGKRMTAHPSALVNASGIWYASVAEVADLKMGSTTTLKITGVKSDETVSNRYFDPQFFYLGN